MIIEEKIFLDKLKKLIEVDNELTLNMKFKDIDGIDSLSYMVISAWISDNFEVKISATEIENLIYLEDLFKIIK